MNEQLNKYKQKKTGKNQSFIHNLKLTDFTKFFNTVRSEA